MRRVRTVGVVALTLLLLVAGGLWLLRGPIALRTMARIYDRNLGEDAIAALPDGLHVGLCGAGAPMPDPTRAGPCVAVVAGRRLFEVDAGAGAARNLALMRLPPARVEAVFLTHFHSDHIDGLGEMLLQHWGSGAATAPLPVYGPTGVDQVVAGFQSAYALDRGYRIAHHGPKVMPPSGFGGAPRPFAISPSGPNVVLINEPDLQVTAFPVAHQPVEPAVGYLFVYKGRRLVVSGDTAPSARLEAAARNADVLVHEALSPRLVAIQRQAALKAGRANTAAILHDILSYHTTPEQAAGIAERAGVRYLLLDHIIPPLPIRALEGPFLSASRQIFHGELRVGQDGDFVSMPAGSSEIHRTARLQTFH